MVKRAWNWWKEAKDIWQTTAFVIGITASTAVIAGVVVIALFRAIRSLPLAWQATLIAAVFVFLVSIAFGLLKLAPFIPVRWNPFKRRIPECMERHLTVDEGELLGVFNTFRLNDRENINGYVNTDVRINLDPIYHQTSPKVEVCVDVWSASVHCIEIGRSIKGSLHEATGLEIGKTPHPLLDDQGNEITLRLNRGEHGSFLLVQDIEPILRERWIQNRLGQAIPFQLSRLFISADVLDPRNNNRLLSQNLSIGHDVKAVLYKRWGWNWQDYDDAIQSMPEMEENL
jgi:hypothetical protein